MNNSYEIKSTEKRAIETELLFNIATARSSGDSLILITVKKKEKSNATKNVVFYLKDAKKRGIIEFFVPEFEISEMGPAASYLLNKYPELTKSETDPAFDVIYVKL